MCEFLNIANLKHLNPLKVKIKPSISGIPGTFLRMARFHGT